MLPALAVGIVVILTGAFSSLTYLWGKKDATKKLLAEKYHFGQKKYEEGLAYAAISDEEMEAAGREALNFILAENELPPLPDPAKPHKAKKKIVKKFKKGKK